MLGVYILLCIWYCICYNDRHGIYGIVLEHSSPRASSVLFDFPGRDQLRGSVYLLTNYKKHLRKTPTKTKRPFTHGLAKDGSIF